MARVCVVGSINNDLTFRVDSLPGPGVTVLASGLVTAPGGKGANQAIAAARAGADVQFAGAVGDDPIAGRLLNHMQHNGVGTDAVVAVAAPSGTAIVIVDSAAENSIVVAPGANAYLTIGPHAQRHLAEADVVLVQLEIPPPTVFFAAMRARQAGATVILNASPIPKDPSTLAELADAVDVVVVNEAEAEHWQWSVPHLVTTRGARGASYVGTEGSFDISAPAVDAVDTAGAGDVFAGVLAAGWHSGPHRAIRRACAAAALATLVQGAGDCAPTRDAIAGAESNATVTKCE